MCLTHNHTYTHTHTHARTHAHTHTHNYHPLSQTSNDLLFAEIREKSRKPDQLYHIIERMVPGGRKVEIFARNHNMRPGWLSLGNQLGEYYDWDHDLIRCDMCTGAIPTGKTRYSRPPHTYFCRSSLPHRPLPPPPDAQIQVAYGGRLGPVRGVLPEVGRQRRAVL
jgi:hypothetical protein